MSFNIFTIMIVGMQALSLIVKKKKKKKKDTVMILDFILMKLPIKKGAKYENINIKLIKINSNYPN